MSSALSELKLGLARSRRPSAERLGVTMLIGNMAKQLWGYSVNRGGARRDSSTLITYLEEWTGVNVVGAAGRAREAKGKNG
jgi:hypothetical protein